MTGKIRPSSKFGSACAAILLLVLPAAPAGAITLRYSLKKGAEVTYRVQAASASRMSVQGEERIEMTSRIDQTYRLRVLEVSPEGVMEMEREVISGTLKISAGEAEREGPLPKGKKRFKVTPLGKVSGVEGPKTAEPEKEEDGEMGGAEGLEAQGPFGWEETGTEMDFLVSGIFVPLPEKEVKPGDSWEEETEIESAALPLPGEQAQKARLKVKSELVELAEREGRKCARIRTSYELPISAEPPAGESFKISLSGKETGEVEWYLDIEKSCTRSAQGNTQFLLKMSVEFPPELEEEMALGPAKETTSATKVNLKILLVEG